MGPDGIFVKITLGGEGIQVVAPPELLILHQILDELGFSKPPIDSSGTHPTAQRTERVEQRRAPEPPRTPQTNVERTAPDHLIVTFTTIHETPTSKDLLCVTRAFAPKAQH